MKTLYRLSFLIGLVLFGVVLWSVDRQRIWEIVSGANIGLLIAGVTLTAFEALFKALKLRSLARIQSICTITDALVVYLVGIPFGAVTPAKAGDLIKIYSLSQRALIGLPEAFAVWVLDRLLDLIVLVAFGALGVLFLLINHTEVGEFYWVIGASVFGILVAALLIQQSLVMRLAKWNLVSYLKKGLFSGLSGTMDRAFDAFYAGMALARKARGRMALAAVFAAMALLAISSRSFVFGVALGLRVGWLDFVLLIPLVTLVELLPVSILGIGTREYAVITIFAFLGVDREQAVSLSLSAFVLSIVPLILGGYLVALKQHLRPKEIKTTLSSYGLKLSSYTSKTGNREHL